MSSMNKVTVDVHPFSGQQVLYQLYIIIQKSLIMMYEYYLSNR